MKKTTMRSLEDYGAYEPAIKIITERFVAELNGRFREYISDKYLISLLRRQTFNLWYSGNRPPITTAARVAAQRLIEDIIGEDYGELEKVKDIGQDYSSRFNQFIIPTRPT